MINHYKFSLLWAIVILVLCLLKPSGNMSKALLIPHLDKIAHFGIHLILACFMLYEYKQQYLQVPTRLLAIRVIIIGISYGIVIELLQRWTTTYRIFDIWDIFANITGTICGALLIIFFKKTNKYERF